MVDFRPSEEATLIRQAVREFIEREVKPYDEKWPGFLADERTYLTPDGHLLPALQEAIHSIRRKSGEHGFYGMYMPKEVGGAGISFADLFFILKDVGRHGFGFSQFVVAGVEGPSKVLLNLDEKQREKWLHPVVKGERSCCFALTEPEAGSDVGNMRTTATKDGDEWVLNGQKTFITNAPYADYAIVFARSDAQSKGLEGVSCFIVDKGTPGYRAGPIQQSILADGLQSEIFLEDCRIPEGNLVGKEGMGFYYAIENIGLTRVGIGAWCVGLAEYLVEKSVEYAKQRHTFGKPISAKQAIQWMIADSATECAAAEFLTLNCCWKLDQGEQVIRESSMVKLYCTEMLFHVADRAVQVHGGNGLMREYPLERIFRLARLLRIPEGTSEIQRWTIAKTLGL